MASFMKQLSLVLSFIALALAGCAVYQNTQTAMKDQLKVTPTWLDNTLKSTNLLSLGLGKPSGGMLGDDACVFSAVKEVVVAAINAEARMGASLIRLFFHDCFVDVCTLILTFCVCTMMFLFAFTALGNGLICICVCVLICRVVNCDAGLLLNDTATFTGEQTAAGNLNSVRGFAVIEQAKQNVKTKCPDMSVSCADILSIAARDSFEKFSGSTYTVTLGRKDARTANLTGANTQLVGPNENLTSQLTKFAAKGFNGTEMVALLGSHTIGFARCPLLCVSAFINPARVSTLNCNCSGTVNATGLVGLDPTPTTWDQRYFSDVVNGQGLLFSDNELLKGNTTNAAVRRYRDAMGAFLTDFAAAMVKMSNLPPSPGVALEIRDVCSRVNANSVASM